MKWHAAASCNGPVYAYTEFWVAAATQSIPKSSPHTPPCYSLRSRLEEYHETMRQYQRDAASVPCQETMLCCSAMHLVTKNAGQAPCQLQAAQTPPSRNKCAVSVDKQTEQTVSSVSHKLRKTQTHKHDTKAAQGQARTKWSCSAQGTEAANRRPGLQALASCDPCTGFQSLTALPPSVGGPDQPSCIMVQHLCARPNGLLWSNLPQLRHRGTTVRAACVTSCSHHPQTGVAGGSGWRPGSRQVLHSSCCTLHRTGQHVHVAQDQLTAAGRRLVL